MRIFPFSSHTSGSARPAFGAQLFIFVESAEFSNFLHPEKWRSTAVHCIPSFLTLKDPTFCCSLHPPQSLDMSECPTSLSSALRDCQPSLDWRKIVKETLVFSILGDFR
jgi:hypothetical protein